MVIKMTKCISADKKRLNDAIGSAQEAFWSVIADKYPEIKSGDMMPLDLFSFENALEKGVTVWLDTNQEEEEGEGESEKD